MVASEDFFKMFSFEIIAGDPSTALNDPLSIVITESTARSLFEDSDPINQFIRINNDDELRVTGVVKDVPAQSSLKFNYVISYGFYEATQEWLKYSKTRWDNNISQLFVELHENAPIEKVNSDIENIIRDNNPNNPQSQLFLHPISYWRLYSNFENGKQSGGLIDYVQIFTGIAIFVLIIACINFMNLATARSESRAREVGIPEICICGFHVLSPGSFSSVKIVDQRLSGRRMVRCKDK
jgi:ABC-type antimicrobial peptide transport system permease subunit